MMAKFVFGILIKGVILGIVIAIAIPVRYLVTMGTVIGYKKTRDVFRRIPMLITTRQNNA